VEKAKSFPHLAAHLFDLPLAHLYLDGIDVGLDRFTHALHIYPQFLKFFP
jgi:hypothetical protein